LNVEGAGVVVVAVDKVDELVAIADEIDDDDDAIVVTIIREDVLVGAFVDKTVVAVAVVVMSLLKQLYFEYFFM
jgi:hypothetical protein